MSLEILQQNRILSEFADSLHKQREALVLFAAQLGANGHAAMFAAAHMPLAQQFLENIRRAMAPEVACAEQALDEARAQTRQGRRVPVAGGVLQVGSWS
jgi:hypothetical protein